MPIVGGYLIPRISKKDSKILKSGIIKTFRGVKFIEAGNFLLIEKQPKRKKCQPSK